MTNDEFRTFSRRLFVAFPSLWEWLQERSPEPRETLAIWAETLEPYTLDECLSVVSRWSTGQLPRFAAWERDYVHVCIRQVIEHDRSQIRKKTEREQLLRNATRSNAMEAIAEHPTMGPAYVRLLQEHERFQSGEIRSEAYSKIKNEILETV